MFKEEFPMRRKKDQITDESEILTIIEAAPYIHWGLSDKNSLYPYVVTTDYGYEAVDGVLTFFIHGAPAGRKLDLIRQDPHVGFSLEAETSLWVPPEAHNYNYSTTYRSVIGTAIAEIIADPGEKAHGLSLLLKRETEETFTEAEFKERDLAHVKMIKCTVQHLSAKQHTK